MNLGFGNYVLLFFFRTLEWSLFYVPGKYELIHSPITAERVMTKQRLSVVE